MEFVQRGFSVDPANHAKARRELRAAPDVDWEARAAREERYGGSRTGRSNSQPAQPFLGWIMGGPLIASFDKADVRMTPGGLTVYGDDALHEIKLGVKGEDGRDGRINTFYDAIVRGRPLPTDGAWGMATLEVLLAIEESAGRVRKPFSGTRYLRSTSEHASSRSSRPERQPPSPLVCGSALMRAADSGNNPRCRSGQMAHEPRQAIRMASHRE